MIELTLGARLTRRDNEIESDWGSIRIDSFHDSQNCYEFTFNPAGVKVDILQFEDGDREDASWDPVWELETQITAAGWSALYEHGIRTIVTLRTDGMQEDELNFTPPYPDLITVQAAIEDITDQEFLQQWAATNLWGTPLYYKDALRRWPERHAAVISAIARAQPGGVLFHCIRGHDRTGIIALLLLAFVGVVPDEIVADYELNPDPERDELLAREHSSVREALLGALEGLNIDRYLVGI